MGLINHIDGKKIYFDSNIFIYLFENHEPYTSLILPVIEAIENGLLHTFTSELTIAEVLVKPFKLNNIHWQNAYRNGIQNSSALSVMPVTRTILIHAAQIRSETNMKLPDCIHLATAQLNGCNTFLTNDDDMKSINEITVLYLKKFISQI